MFSVKGILSLKKYCIARKPFLVTCFLTSADSFWIFLYWFLYKTATTSAVQFSVKLGRLGEWCKMFQSWQLHFTAWHGLICLHCCCCYCSAPCFKTVSPSCLYFLTILVTSLGPSPQSSTRYQQTYPCCTVCLVWLALLAREISLWLRCVTVLKIFSKTTN